MLLQPLVENSIKHGFSRQHPSIRILIALKRTADHLQISIEDNGQGFNVANVLEGKVGKRGVGLASMKERTELAGGLFLLHSIEGGGTNINASWPVRNHKR